MKMFLSLLVLAAVITSSFGYGTIQDNGGYSRVPDSLLFNASDCTEGTGTSTGSCCNRYLPSSCQYVINNLQGQKCEDVIANNECTHCCSDLYNAGLARSTEACCPHTGCGSSVGCEPVSGDCGCRDLSYFTGQIEKCATEGGHCEFFEDCCPPYACFAKVCATCGGRNAFCTSSGQCCGSDVCVGSNCVACGNNDLPSCALRDDGSDSCCSGFNCIDGTCKQCTPLSATCTTDYECCSATTRYRTTFCSVNANGQGICTECMTPDLTANIYNNCLQDSDCCGDNICVYGACTPCLNANMTGCYENADCCAPRCPAPDNSNALICYNGQCEACYPLGSDCNADYECCQGACINGYCACSQLSGDCNKDTDCCGDAVCKNGYCCHSQTGQSCGKPSDCCGQGIHCQLSSYTCQSCFKQGQYCKQNNDCCSGYCVQGYCQ